jgi:hypothetical protein
MLTADRPRGSHPQQHQAHHQPFRHPRIRLAVDHEIFSYHPRQDPQQERIERERDVDGCEGPDFFSRQCDR